MFLSRCSAKAFLASLLLIPAACESGFAPAAEITAVQLVLSEAEIEITDGETRTLKATLLDSRGRSINLATVPYHFDWRVSDPAILEIREAGSEVAISYLTRGTTEVRVTALPASGGSFGSSVVAASNATEPLTGKARVKTNQKPASIEEKGGNRQKGRVKTVLPDSLVVRILDRHGVGVVDERVEFTAVSGAGSADPAVVMTDSTGYARTTWTLGAQDGEQQMEVTASPQVGKMTFVAEALPASANVIEASAGDGQSGDVGTTLPDALQVVVLDEFGNPVPGSTVTWSVVTGGGSLKAAGAQTDADGHATAIWTLGDETGEQQARATHGELSALFTATARGATSTVSSITVSPASLTLDAIGASAQLRATVRDRNGATLTGSAIEWTSSRSETAHVDAAGRVTAKTVGTALIIASTAGLADTSHVTVRQVPASVQLSSSSVSLDVGETEQLNAVVKDAGGTAIPSASVSWKSSAPDVASVTSRGLVDALAAGSASVTAASGSLTATASVTVTGTATPPPPPPPSEPGRGIWMSASEIAALPTSGSAWNGVKAAADKACGTPDLVNQDDSTNTCVMAKALVFARIGGAQYRDGVISALRSIVGAGAYDGRALALGRELGAYVISADLIGLRAIDPALDEAFRARLAVLRTTSTHSGPGDLVECFEKRPNNWGLHCGASLAAVAVYLGDDAALTRIKRVFRGWLGDRSAYASFSYGSDLSWQADAQNPVGINPKGSTKNGHSIDGALPEEMRRCGSFSWPPCSTGYNWEALQGAVAMAWILHRQGEPAFERNDRALLRAVQWLHTHAGDSAEGDDTWIPHIINRMYGSSFPAPVPSRPGKNVGWADWTHGR